MPPVKKKSKALPPPTRPTIVSADPVERQPEHEHDRAAGDEQPIARPELAELHELTSWSPTSHRQATGGRR
jgi:hypothetical protein